jgi:hypothetical protein
MEYVMKATTAVACAYVIWVGVVKNVTNVLLHSRAIVTHVNADGLVTDVIHVTLDIRVMNAIDVRMGLLQRTM